MSKTTNWLIGMQVVLLLVLATTALYAGTISYKDFADSGITKVVSTINPLPVRDGLIWCEQINIEVQLAAGDLPDIPGAKFVSLQVEPDETNKVWCQPGALGDPDTSVGSEATAGLGFGVTDNTNEISCVAITDVVKIMGMVFKESC